MFCSSLSTAAFKAASATSVLLISSCIAASAHDAPTGWKYPYACCSGLDCRPVSKKQISERPEGFVITNTGEVIASTDTRLRDSPDGEYHWCSVAGEEHSRTICLFVPPRGF
jgi:hypothetical protein